MTATAIPIAMLQQSGRSGMAQRPSAVGLNGMQILRRDPAQDRRSGRKAAIGLQVSFA
jgi:hypothetical protein